MAFGKRQAKPVAVTVKSFGEDITLNLRPLSALEVDAIKRRFPPPLAPRKEIDGSAIIDVTDDEYRRKESEWREAFLLIQVCEQLGPENFEPQDDLGRVRALQESFTERELVALVTQAILIGRGDITPQDTEAAKQALAPFENGVPETASTSRA